MHVAERIPIPFMCVVSQQLAERCADIMLPLVEDGFSVLQALPGGHINVYLRWPRDVCRALSRLRSWAARRCVE